MLYADVCVNTPLGPRVGPSLGVDVANAADRTFTYSVPERLAGRLQPGHLVWVLFRARRLQAVVLALSETPPDFETKDIVALVWAQPVLTPAQLTLAYWLSEYYLVPLIEALRLMLPGISKRGRTVLVRTARPAPAGLTPSQRALLERIALAEGTWAEVSEGLRDVTQQADLEPLLQRDLVTREVAFPTPLPHPKTGRLVRLLVDEQTIARILPSLGHSSRQADALAWLAAQDDPLPALDDLRAALGGGEAAVQALCEQGQIRVLPRRSRVRRTVADADLPVALAGLARAPKQAATLAALSSDLVDEVAFLAEHQKAGPALRELVSKGLAERFEEPALVSLVLDRGQVPDVIVAQRGAEKHRAVLQALAQRPDGTAWVGWVYAETDANLGVLRDLEAAGLISLAEEMVWRDPLDGRQFTLDQPPALTEDQQRVWAIVQAGIRKAAGGSQRPPAYLLHGVTGSGKTEIYLHGIAEVLESGQQAVVLVPEIALTPQTIRRFAARFPGQVTVWHSELSEGERFDVWRRVRTKHPAAQVVVGSRSALFLPFPRLGLIVVDEEHETSYKQERTPRYHARTVAVQLGRIARAPVLLGSATPGLESYYAAQQGTMQLLVLSQRIVGHAAVTNGRTAPQGGSAPGELRSAAGQPAGQMALPLGPAAPASDLPAVQVVDMRQELRAGNRSMFSRPLSEALRRVLAAGQQAILYLNRRGTATFVLCRDCGHVEACPRCAVPLTYHSAAELLICHHCNRRYPIPLLCPQCASPRIRYFGSGTQSVEEVANTIFPTARCLRWDRDVTGSKGAHDAILSRFTAHEADILIGTQMIAKGLDLPLVTLVGVLAADIGLFLPDFRAAERTFQLLTQVAGRAGRSALGGKVIVQTYHPDHYAIVAASHHDYDSFYRQEMAFRREQCYPPLCRLARLVCYNSRQAKAQAEATQLAEQLNAVIERLAVSDTDLIGPAPCFFGQQRGLYRWQVILRSPDPISVLRHVPLPLGCRMDIDPVELL